MEYIIVKDGIITGHMCGKVKPVGAIEVPAGFPGFVGEKLAAIKDDFSGLKPVSQQVAEGILPLPDGLKPNDDDDALIRMDQEEIDAVFPLEVWAFPDSYEAIPVHKTFDRYSNFGYHAPVGAVKMLSAQPSNDYKAKSDGTWTFDIDKGKVSKLAEINSKYNVATSSLVSTYPSTEVLTFDKQEQEARAWLADNSVSTPLINALAHGRGIDKAELVRRIIAKADAFTVATGYLTGQRQKYEDKLEAATTAEEIEAIVPEYELPKSETPAEKVKLSPYYDL